MTPNRQVSSSSASSNNRWPRHHRSLSPILDPVQHVSLLVIVVGSLLVTGCGGNTLGEFCSKLDKTFLLSGSVGISLAVLISIILPSRLKLAYLQDWYDNLERRRRNSRERNAPLEGRIVAALEIARNAIGAGGIRALKHPVQWLKRQFIITNDSPIERYLREADQLLTLSERKLAVWERCNAQLYPAAIWSQCVRELKLFDQQVLRARFPIDDNEFKGLKHGPIQRAEALLDQYSVDHVADLEKEYDSLVETCSKSPPAGGDSFGDISVDGGSCEDREHEWREECERLASSEEVFRDRVSNLEQAIRKLKDAARRSPLKNEVEAEQYSIFRETWQISSFPFEKISSSTCLLCAVVQFRRPVGSSWTSLQVRAGVVRRRAPRLHKMAPPVVRSRLFSSKPATGRSTSNETGDEGREKPWKRAYTLLKSFWLLQAAVEEVKCIAASLKEKAASHQKEDEGVVQAADECIRLATELLELDGSLRKEWQEFEAATVRLVRTEEEGALCELLKVAREREEKAIGLLKLRRSDSKEPQSSQFVREMDLRLTVWRMICWAQQNKEFLLWTKQEMKEAENDQSFPAFERLKGKLEAWGKVAHRDPLHAERSRRAYLDLRRILDWDPNNRRFAKELVKVMTDPEAVLEVKPGSAIWFRYVPEAVEIAFKVNSKEKCRELAESHLWRRRIYVKWWQRRAGENDWEPVTASDASAESLREIRGSGPVRVLCADQNDRPDKIEFAANIRLCEDFQRFLDVEQPPLAGKPAMNGESPKLGKTVNIEKGSRTRWMSRWNSSQFFRMVASLVLMILVTVYLSYDAKNLKLNWFQALLILLGIDVATLPLAAMVKQIKERLFDGKDEKSTAQPGKTK